MMRSGRALYLAAPSPDQSDNRGATVVLLDLTGQRFGRLTVVERAPNNQGQTRWLCHCDCGTERNVNAGSLQAGLTLSCGCLGRERRIKSLTKHGLARSPQNRVWSAIKDRCLNPNDHGFASYGGRGITICDRWRDSFAAFYADMGPRPSPGLAVERIDNDGPYSPENCRWATQIEQCNNTRRNVWLTYAERTQTVAQWSRETGIGSPTIRWRLKQGWSIERALTEPVH